jgi:hypothetical protein
VFILIEVGVYLAAALSYRRTAYVLMAAVLLLLFPFYSIGFSNDFVMRSSIPSLAILSFAVISMLTDPTVRGGMRAALAFTLAVGLLTPASEVFAAVTYPSWSASSCSFEDAWLQGPVYDKSPAAYVAPLREPLPGFARPKGGFIEQDAAAVCWPVYPRTRIFVESSQRKIPVTSR